MPLDIVLLDKTFPRVSPAMSSSDPVQLEVSGAVATLRLNRPEVRNALSVDLVECLARRLAEIREQPALGAVVVCGAGKGLCAGADLSELGSHTPDEAAAFQRRTAEVFDQLAELPVPSVAAIHGFAVGGGFFLTLYCDLRLATPDARLGFPAAARQWIPPWALSRLASWVGVRRAEQLLLTQSLFTTASAAGWGLVDEVVPNDQLLSGAQALAERITDTPREVVREIRQFFSALRGFEHRTWDQLSSAGFQRRIGAPAAQQAMQAFFSQRSS